MVNRWKNVIAAAISSTALSTGAINNEVIDFTYEGDNESSIIEEVVADNISCMDSAKPIF